jgi:hypothetical protein
MAKMEFVRCGRLIWTEEGNEYTTEMYATPDGTRFRARGATEYGEDFTARWTLENCRADGTIAGMPGFTLIRDAVLPVTGHCHQPGCTQLFYNCRSDKENCDWDNGDGSCKQKQERQRKALERERQRALKQRLATGGTVR